MAIFHLSTKIIARSLGRSAVGAAAYRSGSLLYDRTRGVGFDYRRRRGILETKIFLPKGVAYDLSDDREALWNAAERAERRCDARVAREFVVALPHELNAQQQLDLLRTFAGHVANTFGVAVDVAHHAPSGGDLRNFHGHLLSTTRLITAHGLSEKSLLERENAWLARNRFPTTRQMIKALRRDWEVFANDALAAAGCDARIDHRSHADAGLSLEPTTHVGVHATALDRKGLGSARAGRNAAVRDINAAIVKNRPEEIIEFVSQQKSVFTEADLSNALLNHLPNPVEFQKALTTIMASPELVKIAPARTQGGKRTPARYATISMVNTEAAMLSAVKTSAQQHDCGVSGLNIVWGIDRTNRAIKMNLAARLGSEAPGKISEDHRLAIAEAGLSAEQQSAVRHIVGPERVSAVVGVAGSGKSTMLETAREIWEAEGYRVLGAALSGKACENLAGASGIASHTLASWQLGWENGKRPIGPKDVFVIDEAAMVGTVQMAYFVEKVRAAGAKLVLVGDAEQLQAIDAGAAFRAICNTIGVSRLTEVRRQRDEWQRAASLDFAMERTAVGLDAYIAQRRVKPNEDRAKAISAMVQAYALDVHDRPDHSRIALAHRRADVFEINRQIRERLQQDGKLPAGNAAGEHIYRTNNGDRTFVAGDRLIFLENNREFSVKNGMLATVVAAAPDRIVVDLDGPTQGGGRRIEIPTSTYGAFDHGYASTIHKSQGSTVDRAFVLASSTMDRHLTYVALTRHRDDVTLFVDRQEIPNIEALKSALSRDGSKTNVSDFEDQHGNGRLTPSPQGRPPPARSPKDALMNILNSSAMRSKPKTPRGPVIPTHSSNVDPRPTSKGQGR